MLNANNNNNNIFNLMYLDLVVRLVTNLIKHNTIIFGSQIIYQKEAFTLKGESWKKILMLHCY